MCRSNFGPCIGVGCGTIVTCRDGNGWCNEHNPLVFYYCECEDECVCPEPTYLDVDPIKKQGYTVSLAKSTVKMSQARLRGAKKILEEQEEIYRELSR